MAAVQEAAVKVWTCQRQQDGVRCGKKNPSRFQVCRSCGKRKPPRRRPAHLKALEQPYEVWVERFGEVCGICGRAPSVNRRLDRDHDHKTGEPRGLLCHFCNRTLSSRVDAVWLRSAADYLEGGLVLSS